MTDENEKADCTKKYPLVTVRGLIVPSFISVKYVEDTIDFKPQDTDIFVVTYPKCGTTWTQYIVWEILHKGAPPPTPNKMLVREFPFLEMVGTNIPDDMPPPRTLKTHLPFSLQPYYNPNSKYIYVVRNPWDCCVSYYHHLQFDITTPPLTFDEHFELFIKGEVGWGDFFDHVLSWFKHRNDPNVLFLTYEDMKKDNRKSLMKIAKFLGESYYNDLKDDQIMENCLKHTDFKYMKDLGMFFPNVAKEDMKSLDFAEFVKKFGELDPSKANPEEIREVNFFRKETACTKKYPLVTVRGLLLPALISLKNVEDTIDFKPQDTDIFVVTYPKCGTTWTQYIVWEILHKGAPPPTPNKMMVREFPFLEMVGTKIPDDIPPPRTMKTHLPFHLQPYNPKSKYIYIVRNPWDCCVSYYHHLQFDTTTPPLTFDEHFELFIRGEVGYGDFFDHALSWFEHRNDPNILFLTYEDMKKDKRKSLMKIAKFLGESYYNDLKDDQVLENCLKHTDFKYMKDLGMFFPNVAKEDMKSLDFAEFVKKFGELDPTKANPEEIREVNFFRKGEVGDWKNHFSPDQIKRFNEYMSRKLQNTEMENFWKLQPEETSL